MHDRSVEKADRIEAKTLAELERIYPAAVSPLMRKHKNTLEKLARLEKQGAYGRARVLLRKSGLVDDLAHALAAAGVRAARLIRKERQAVREADADGAEDR